MKFTSYQCEFCNRDYPAQKTHLVRLEFPPKPEPVRVVGTVKEWYAGIRIICKSCVEGLKSLEEIKS